MRERGFSTFLAAGATLVLAMVVGCQVPPGPDLVKGNPNASTCPNGHALGNFQSDANVSAGFSNNGTITTYFFASLTNENSIDGVPGLIKYCVYPTPAVPPTAIDALAKGANGDAWTSSAGSSDFSFGRPNGNPSNIPLDGTNFSGTSTVMGTATWDQVPSDQTILLHINDPTVCANLYGDDPGSCFVLPGQALACITDHGQTNVAYNAMPFGAADCPGASLGFEATGTSEFGEAVNLAGSARQLVSLKVLFASYACQSGHWNTGDCSTASGATFTEDLPITATIYSVKDCSGAPCPDQVLATVTAHNQTIPYRPSADNTQCTGGDQGKWFNPVAGACKNQISIVLTFDFTNGPTLPAQVIWTVAFNTTSAGHNPIGPAACSTNCFYDSFNVGAQSFLNAPYAGSDALADYAVRNGVAESGWGPNRPLGEIITQ